jgi:hypothetical protein
VDGSTGKVSDQEEASEYKKLLEKIQELADYTVRQSVKKSDQ